MATTAQRKRALRIRRHARVRKQIVGTTGRPRLAVFRSARHISAQVIDDTTGRTVAAAGTVEADSAVRLRRQRGGRPEGGSPRSPSGPTAAGVTKVVFDRGGFRYHGRVAALADAARKAGLEF